MAFYVRLRKLNEDADSATYSFSSNERDFGQAELDKRSGEVKVVKRVRDDAAGNIATRAAAKLRREWRSGRLPNMTEWAS